MARSPSLCRLLSLLSAYHPHCLLFVLVCVYSGACSPHPDPTPFPPRIALARRITGSTHQKHMISCLFAVCVFRLAPSSATTVRHISSLSCPPLSGSEERCSRCDLLAAAGFDEGSGGGVGCLGAATVARARVLGDAEAHACCRRARRCEAPPALLRRTRVRASCAHSIVCNGFRRPLCDANGRRRVAVGYAWRS